MAKPTEPISAEQLSNIYENIAEVAWAVQQLTESTGDILKLAAAITEVSDRASDLASYHPDYDVNLGSIPMDYAE